MTGIQNDARVPLRRSDAFRIMGLSTLLAGLSNGIFAATSFLYFTKILSFDSLFVGSCLTVSGIAAVIISSFAGRHLEKIDLSRFNGFVLIVQALTTAMLAWTKSGWSFVCVILIVMVASKYKIALRGTFIAVAFTGADRTIARAWFRALNNGGMAAGGLLASVVILNGTLSAYTIAMVSCGVLFLIGGCLFYAPSIRGLRVAEKIYESAEEKRARLPLKNKGYVLMALLNGLLGIHYFLIQIGLPLWAAQSPERLVWVVSMALVINTLVIVTSQVPLARFVTGRKRAVRAQLVAGVGFLLACLLIFFAGSMPVSPQTVTIAIAVIIYSLGEILQSSSSWELSYEMADSSHPGEYQALFATLSHIGPVLAPIVLTAALSAFQEAAWLGIGIFLVALSVLHLMLNRSKLDDCQHDSNVSFKQSVSNEKHAN